MRAAAVCPGCMEVKLAAGKKPLTPIISGELDDNGSIHVQCKHGHTGVVVFDCRRYQVLVESAARAFLDGYTNEVVAVMSSALERSYEFYIRVSCRSKKIDQSVLERQWKGVSAQSERQLGAFLFLYLLDQEEIFAIDPAITETRNRVVHRGRIVREKEALDYAEAVYELILQIEKAMRRSFDLEVKAEALREVEAQVTQIPAGIKHVKLKTMTVSLNEEKNEVIAEADKFMDFVKAIHTARKNGLEF